MQIDDLSEPERALWDAFPCGDLVDLSSGDAAADDLNEAEDWGPERTIRAEVIAALLLGARSSEPGHVPAARIAGARIDGPLNLGHAEVVAPLTLAGCYFTEIPHLYWARLRSVHLTGCRLPGLIASGSRIDGHLWLEDAWITGSVLLDGAHVTGILNLSNAHLSNPGQDALLGDRLTVDANVYCDNGFLSDGEIRLPGARVGGQLILRGARLRNSPIAFYGSRLTVAANVFCDSDFIADGEVRLRGARIGGYLSLVGATISNPGRTALNADDLAVETDVYCSDGFLADGTVTFSGARIGGQLSLRDAQLANPGGKALCCQRMQAEEMLLRPARPVTGTVDFGHARVTLLRDEPATWPEEIQLDGLTYQTLDPPMTSRERLEWLSRDTDGIQPQPYEQLAQSYRALGQDGEGRAVLLAKQRHRRATQTAPHRVWGYMQDMTVGYGYRPLRAAGWLAALLAIGTVVFAVHRPDNLSVDERPHFNAFLYTLDLLLPLVSFGQETSFSPEGLHQWIAGALVAAGGVLAVTVAAGVTRVLSRD